MYSALKNIHALRSLCRYSRGPTRSVRFLTVLGIETSCDDTSICLLEASSPSPNQDSSNKPIIHALYTKRALEEHEKYGGIYPPLAIETHQVSLGPLIEKMQRENPVEFGNVGLVGSLTIGLEVAKGLALGKGVPIIGVHHMQAHSLVARLLNPFRLPRFPFYSLLVSGGHTMLVRSDSLVNHTVLVQTVDIAIGDFLDKCAKYLQIPWEGRMPAAAMETWCEGQDGDSDVFKLPTPLDRRKAKYSSTLAFSFVGLETAIKRLLDKECLSIEEKKVLASEIQTRSFSHLCEKTALALSKEAPGMVNSLVVSGGVASNTVLKKVLWETLEKYGIKEIQLYFPPPYLCSDNAAMIAWAGLEMYEAGFTSTFDMRPIPKWPIAEYAP